MADRIRRKASFGQPPLSTDVSSKPTAKLPEQLLQGDEVAIRLTTRNPDAPRSHVQFDYRLQQLVSRPVQHDLIQLFSQESRLVPKPSCGLAEVASAASKRAGLVETPVGTDGAHDAAEDKAADSGPSESEKFMKLAQLVIQDNKQQRTGRSTDKKLTNAFNFCERASQTAVRALRESCTQTEAARRAIFGATVSPWRIQDAYTGDQERQALEKSGQIRSAPVTSGEGRRDVSEAPELRQDGEEDLSGVAGLCRIVERIVNQNTYDDIIQDFRYYEDPSDDLKDKEGTLLPLWKFSFAQAKGLAVTDVHWFPQHPDLLVATFGSYSFLEQSAGGSGLVCVYALNNPSYPEYYWRAASGVMCCHVRADLLCVGMRDGSVCVLSLSTSARQPVVLSRQVKGRHSDAVVRVRWADDDIDGNRNFYSTSADGRLLNWQLVLTELRCTPVLTLPDGAGGSALAFRHDLPHLYAIGTDQGAICCGSVQRTAGVTVPTARAAHGHAVLSLDWNWFRGDVLASCGADWRLLVWRQGQRRPLLQFDLGSAAGAVAWSPYSSTVLAACTVDGRVHVFDLDTDRYRPVCVQAVLDARKTHQLTRLAFNPTQPILALGDTRGTVATVKLSPNLRRRPKEAKNADDKRCFQLELDKMDKLLRIVSDS